MAVHFVFYKPEEPELALGWLERVRLLRKDVFLYVDSMQLVLSRAPREMAMTSLTTGTVLKDYLMYPEIPTVPNQGDQCIDDSLSRDS